jgi:bacillithiol system protein YtxJ
MIEKMKWNELKTEEQIKSICEESKEQPVLIFKHSTRCSISATVLNRLERNWQSSDELTAIKPYYLDLISYRNISNQIASYFGVEHESPQILLVHNGKPKLVRSHMAIDINEIKEHAKAKN